MDEANIPIHTKIKYFEFMFILIILKYFSITSQSSFFLTEHPAVWYSDEKNDKNLYIWWLLSDFIYCILLSPK